MVSIIFIFCGFALLMLAEWRYVLAHRKSSQALQQKMSRLLPSHTVVQVLGYSQVAAGILFSLLRKVPDVQISPLVRAISLGAGILGGGLLVWTVFFEIPVGLKKHRVEPGYTYHYGSYGICRHPGFWWFLLCTLGIAFLKSDFYAFLLFFFENALNLLLILLQDKYTFIVQFRDYGEYSKRVPFLLPKSRRRG